MSGGPLPQMLLNWSATFSRCQFRAGGSKTLPPSGAESCATSPPCEASPGLELPPSCGATPSESAVVASVGPAEAASAEPAGDEPVLHPSPSVARRTIRSLLLVMAHSG